MRDNVLGSVWSQDGNQFLPVSSIVSTIPMGEIYSVGRDGFGRIMFEKKDRILDQLYELPSSLAESIINEIKKFWGKKEVYNSFNLIWKRGILLHGNPGIGKTSITNLVINFFLKENGVVLYSKRASNLTEALPLFRERHPSVPLLVVLEDIDQYVDYDEEDLLALIDGENQVENIVYMATTNYFADLPDRISNRPGRFDIIREATPPSKEVRFQYFKAKFEFITADPLLVEKMINDSEGFTFSQLKEFIINIFCLETDYNEALERVKKFTFVDEPNNSDSPAKCGEVTCSMDSTN